MDKKTIIFSLFAISFFICVFAFAGCSNLTSLTIPNSVTTIGEYANTYGQNEYEKEIEWKSKDKIEQIVFADTLQIKGVYAEYGIDACDYTKSMIINNTCLFFKFFPVGFGESIFSIEIYKQVYDQWRLVAKGEVRRPVCSITAEFDPSNNNIVFYTLIFEFDSNTKKYKSKRKVEEIGKISISDL